MLTNLVIAFREFLEAFLIIGVFLGINKKLNLKKTKEIIIASLIGISFSLILPIISFYFSNLASLVINKKNAEILEGYLSIFSGLFLTYVVFSLHKSIHRLTNKNLIIIHQKLQNKIFDLSLFLLITFFVIREGFEIALFTSTVSLFSNFWENLFGLFLGFSIALLIGLMIYFSYLKLSIKKIYNLTEWLIIFLGGSMIINGINEILEVYFHQKLSNFFPIKIEFLPSNSSIIGHFLKSMFSLQKDFSLLSILIMIIYILFLKKILFKSKKAVKI